MSAHDEQIAFLKNRAKKMRALATDHPTDLSPELHRQADQLEQQAEILEADFGASPAKPRSRYRIPSFM
jgi:hypothetical protein